LTATLSAPARSMLQKSSIFLIPPPTVSGTNFPSPQSLAGAMKSSSSDGGVPGYPLACRAGCHF
jgi:hypothetical protein